MKLPYTKTGNVTRLVILPHIVFTFSNITTCPRIMLRYLHVVHHLPGQRTKVTHGILLLPQVSVRTPSATGLIQIQGVETTTLLWKGRGCSSRAAGRNTDFRIYIYTYIRQQRTQKVSSCQAKEQANLSMAHWMLCQDTDRQLPNQFRLCFGKRLLTKEFHAYNCHSSICHTQRGGWIRAPGYSSFLPKARLVLLRVRKLSPSPNLSQITAKGNWQQTSTEQWGIWELGWGLATLLLSHGVVTGPVIPRACACWFHTQTVCCCLSSTPWYAAGNCWGWTAPFWMRYQSETKALF